MKVMCTFESTNSHIMPPKDTKKTKKPTPPANSLKRTVLKVTFPTEQKQLYSDCISMSKETGMDLATLGRMSLKRLTDDYKNGTLILSK